MKRNGEGRSFIPVALIALMIVIAMIVSTVWFYGSVQDQLFAERQRHLTEMTIKISEVINITVETMQDKTDATKQFIQQNAVTEDNVTDLLTSVSSMIPMDEGALLAMDSQGDYYSSEGVTGRWSTMEDLVYGDEQAVIREFYLGGTRQDCVIFLDRLEGDIVINEAGHTLTHVAYVMPMSSMDDYLSISIFGDECDTYLINQDGRSLYKETTGSQLVTDFNVIRDLQSDEFLRGGTMEDLEEAVANRDQFCAEFSKGDGGENYFVSTVPVNNTAWTVLLFVPTQTLGVQTSEFTSFVIRFFLWIALAVAGIFACLFYVAMTSNHNKKMLLQQQENNQKLAIAAEEARSANEAKSVFLAHMSHDMRTPINGIIGMTNMAEKNRGDQEKIDDCLEKIGSAADHLLSLVNDVLDMSAIESGKVVISHAHLDIRTLINNCISIVGGQMINRKLEFIQDCDDFAHPYLYGDELHLRNVFINILGNAVKFTPDGGRITFRAKELSCENNRATYRFECEDTGIGISEEFQKKIFEEFSQDVDSGRTTYKGTGLGMAISKQYVDLMGGQISVKSKVGEGSLFIVELTFDVSEEVEEKPVFDIPGNLEGMKVLLVEDNELNMEIAKDILSDEDIQITEAENGKIAVDKFTASEPGSFDAILMDIMMPEMNGYDATRAIRASDHPEAKTIPIIAMTANTYREDVEKSMAAGMNAHIGKPIDIDVLLSTLGQYWKNAG